MFSVEHMLETFPLSRDDEQRFPVMATDRTGEAAPVELYGFQNLSSFPDPHTTAIGHVRIPESIVCPQANPVRHPVSKIGPYPMVYQPSVGLLAEKRPSPSTAMISWVPQSANQNRPACHLADSTNMRSFRRTLVMAILPVVSFFI